MNFRGVKLIACVPLVSSLLRYLHRHQKLNLPSPENLALINRIYIYIYAHLFPLPLMTKPLVRENISDNEADVAWFGVDAGDEQKEFVNLLLGSQQVI